MNTIKNLICFIFIGINYWSAFGGCPFSKYTDVVTACTGANEFGIVYPAGTSGKEVDMFPLRPNKRPGKGYTHGIGCLDETPSPAWYAIKIDENGDLVVKISHSGSKDIDFVCWGPFQGNSKQEMLEKVCANADKYFVDHEVPNASNTCRQMQMDQCETRFAVGPDATEIEKIESRNKISECKMEVDRRSKTDPSYECFYGNYDAFPIADMVDCSFSNSLSESCFIGGAKKGEWYLLLVTNFSGVAGSINFTQIGGSASTDCSVVVDAGSNSPVCETSDIKLFVNNMPAYATCRWTGPNGFESNEVSPTISNVTRGDAGFYYVQITTHDGLKSEEYPVYVSVIPNAPIDTTIRVVKGDVVNFHGVDYSQEGFYQLNESSGQCTKEFKINVVLVPPLPAFIEQNGPICEGEALTLSIGDAPTSGVSGYEWSGPNGFHSSLETPVVSNMTPNKAGKYSLRIKKDGLSYPVTPVDVKVIPKIKEKVSQHIPYGESFVFNGDIISKRGLYSATFKSVYGCDSIVDLFLIPDAPELVPDIFFTPNGDGDNDVWYIKNIDLCPESVVRIYDRYGKKVFEGTEYSQDNAWNGKDLNGRDLPSSDYWYSIDVQSADKVYYGHVTLMR